VIRIAPIRAQDQVRARYQRTDDSSGSLEKNASLVQQDLAEPNEAQSLYLWSQAQGSIHGPCPAHRRREVESAQIGPLERRPLGDQPALGQTASGEHSDSAGILNPSIEQTLTAFGSASSTQIIQLYKTGLNMRPNTPIGTYN